MVRSARLRGWTELALALESLPPAVIEQEDVSVLLPDVTGRTSGPFASSIKPKEWCYEKCGVHRYDR